MADKDAQTEAGGAAEGDGGASGQALEAEVQQLHSETLMIEKLSPRPTSSDINSLKGTVASLLHLVQCAATNLSDKLDVSPFVGKARSRIAEAITQAADIADSAELDDTAHLSAVLAEAVGDVPVQEARLTQLVFSLVYRRSLESVIKRVAKGGSKRWLEQLLQRPPMVTPLDEDYAKAKEQWVCTAFSQLRAAKAWAHEAGLKLRASTQIELGLIQLLTSSSSLRLRSLQLQLNELHDEANSGGTIGGADEARDPAAAAGSRAVVAAERCVGLRCDASGKCGGNCGACGCRRDAPTVDCIGCAAREAAWLASQRGAQRLLLPELVERAVAGILQGVLLQRLRATTVPDDDVPLHLRKAWELPGARMRLSLRCGTLPCGSLPWLQHRTIQHRTHGPPTSPPAHCPSHCEGARAWPEHLLHPRTPVVHTAPRLPFLLTHTPAPHVETRLPFMLRHAYPSC